MQTFLSVRWTVVPALAPQPWIVCSTCGGPKPFRSSDRLRLNANGRKLDAWLIYKCTACDKTWNRTLFERKNVREIDPATLEALHANDGQWIRRHAFDIEAIRRKAQRVDTFADCSVHKTVLAESPAWQLLEIVLSVPLPCPLRLDRLLAAELGVSRSRLQALHEAGRLCLRPERKDALRRPAADGGYVILDVEGSAERDALGWAARGRQSA